MGKITNHQCKALFKQESQSALQIQNATEFILRRILQRSFVQIKTSQFIVLHTGLSPWDQRIKKTSGILLPRVHGDVFVTSVKNDGSEVIMIGWSVVTGWTMLC